MIENQYTKTLESYRKMFKYFYQRFEHEQELNPHLQDLDNLKEMVEVSQCIKCLELHANLDQALLLELISEMAAMLDMFIPNVHGASPGFLERARKLVKIAQTGFEDDE